MFWQGVIMRDIFILGDHRFKYYSKRLTHSTKQNKFPHSIIRSLRGVYKGLLITRDKFAVVY